MCKNNAIKILRLCLYHVTFDRDLSELTCTQILFLIPWRYHISENSEDFIVSVSTDKR